MKPKYTTKTGNYSNGNKKYEDYWKNGKLHGISAYWYENGNKFYESHWKNNNRHGIYTVWYENGQKDYECHFRNGKLLTSKYFKNNECYICVDNAYKLLSYNKNFMKDVLKKLHSLDFNNLQICEMIDNCS